MKKALMNVVILASIGLVGCASNSQNENTGLGVVGGGAVGGIVGGLAGGSPAAVGIGIVAGAVIGGLIGHSMDSSDHSAMNNAMTHNATNEPTYWTNSKTGAQYKVTPTSNIMTVGNNPNCRKFKSTAIINGKRHKVNGVACRQSNGIWKAVD